MDTQKHIHHGLALVSFGMTGLFGFSLASGLAALLFAVSLVLIQASSLLFMPERFRQAKQKDSGIEMLLYGGVIVSALLLSMVASVATLSGSYEQSALSQAERASLQKAMDGYIEAGYITKGLAVHDQLEALPEIEVTPLSSAAARVEAVTGVEGSLLVTAFITLLAFLLDLSVILLNRHTVTQTSNKRYAVTEPVTEASNTESTDIQPSANLQKVTEASNTESHYTVTDEPPALAQTTPEVRAVVEALNDGLIKKPSVREIRQLLRCSQNHAALIARNCRQLELSI